ncbi:MULTISPECIES: flagellar protein export ATPase FliI [unclassified Methylobacterium]|uniref:flagellar protein export ATPase FliI n=1 Tax=unclassified Methylobacterium TaxID=2615210 RepID=UPI0006F70440|nr:MULTISPECIES: flagellar protein export ATPase FliI [unclassified Methylobacterium]KQO66233.1 flagellar protein export ATPase FliI [Methylobacterium sp. Leaf89]KQO72476.1 flagellar protein export ATPase FliI [Methylobacterium sp. Leaf88]KQT81988.1 flagellar protein export ATPase FliI [Methylobacterium sp. Leaf465]KQU30154.1 flagellar protein export ATPase FliI [Methylobacterium sp. Leaf94]
MPDLLDRLGAALARGREALPLVRVGGPIQEVTASAARVAGVAPFMTLGDRMGFLANGREQIGEVVRVDAGGVTVKPFDSRIEAGIGTLAYRLGDPTLRPDPSWKGRVIDALGRPIDGLGDLVPGARAVPLEAAPPPAMERARVTQPLRTGVRALDLFTPLCLGQRIGIFAGSGVGKSTLLAMLAGATGFDSVVVALVGERGREVREFLDGAMAPNRARSVIVVSTGDESPMMRRQAPKMALAIAESFRDAGESVLLIVDSVTRYAHAARDVALAAGEPAVARGYPPSVFSDLPRLLERAGPGLDGAGTITGVFSVLVDGDDHNDPVADSIRGTLDGHVVLDRAIAEQGRYPAVHLLGSISRLASEVWTPEQRELVRRLKAMMARFEETRDLRLMGGYRTGEDAELDQAILLVPRIYEALRQEPGMAASQDAFLELAQFLRT